MLQIVMLDVNGAIDDEFWVWEGGDQLIFQPLRGLLTIKCSAFLYLNVIHCFCAHSLFEHFFCSNACYSLQSRTLDAYAQSDYLYFQTVTSLVVHLSLT